MGWLLGSLESYMRIHNNANGDFDFLVIVDRKLYPTVLKLLKDSTYRFAIKYLIVEDSLTTMAASINKLRIYEYPFIKQYKNILFLDSDIIVTLDIHNILKTNLKDNLLYVYKEKDDLKEHSSMFWSLGTYTSSDHEYFKTHQIYPFNAGCFMFANTQAMEAHFRLILEWIKDYKGPFFYEQSFMNVYFNKRRLVDYSVITNENYLMFPDLSKMHDGKIIHFCGNPGNGSSKVVCMEKYVNDFLSFVSCSNPLGPFKPIKAENVPEENHTLVSCKSNITSQSGPSKKYIL